MRTRARQLQHVHLELSGSFPRRPRAAGGASAARGLRGAVKRLQKMHMARARAVASARFGRSFARQAKARSSAQRVWKSRERATDLQRLGSEECQAVRKALHSPKYALAFGSGGER